MNGALVFFWILAALSVITALGVVLNRNPIRCALLLVINFICLAVFYVLLNAQVLALLQILVYAGAIMVLFLFVIQLLNLGGETATTDPLVGQRFVGLILGLCLLTGLVYGINSTVAHPGGNAPAFASSTGQSSMQTDAGSEGAQTAAPPVVTPPSEGLKRVMDAEKAGVSQIQVIGWDLFTRYLYPFELTSLLLLVGVIGVILLTKRPAAVPDNARS